MLAGDVLVYCRLPLAWGPGLRRHARRGSQMSVGGRILRGSEHQGPTAYTAPKVGRPRIPRLSTLYYVIQLQLQVRICEPCAFVSLSKGRKADRLEEHNTK